MVDFDFDVIDEKRSRIFYESSIVGKDDREHGTRRRQRIENVLCAVYRAQ